MNAHPEVTASIVTAFASEAGPARGRDPHHCSECEEADRMLLDLDPIDLNYDDVASERQNWIFAFATDESMRWLTPGFIRVAMEQRPPQPHLFFDQISQRASDIFSEEQWIAILDFADCCCDKGWVSRSDLGFIGPGECENGE